MWEPGIAVNRKRYETVQYVEVRTDDHHTTEVVSTAQRTTNDDDQVVPTNHASVCACWRNEPQRNPQIQHRRHAHLQSKQKQ